MRKMICTAAVFCVACLTGCGSGYRFERYENADLYTAGGASYAANQVRKIEIDWVGGSIEIEQGDGVNVYEESGRIAQEEQMRYYLAGDVLKIKYCSSGHRGKIDDATKNLQVEIPSGVSLEIDAVSASVLIGVIQLDELDLETGNGRVEAERIACNKAEIETVGGNVSVGELRTAELKAESVSGELSFGFSSYLRAELDNARGNIFVRLADGLGARVLFETKKGALLTDRLYETQGTAHIFAGTQERACEIDVETTQGDLCIL